MVAPASWTMETLCANAEDYIPVRGGCGSLNCQNDRMKVLKVPTVFIYIGLHLLVLCRAVFICIQSVRLMHISFSSSRCQLSPYCKDEPCKNGGTCFDSLDGAVCQCDSGFRGER